MTVLRDRICTGLTLWKGRICVFKLEVFHFYRVLSNVWQQTALFIIATTAGPSHHFYLGSRRTGVRWFKQANQHRVRNECFIHHCTRTKPHGRLHYVTWIELHAGKFSIIATSLWDAVQKLTCVNDDFPQDVTLRTGEDSVWITASFGIQSTCAIWWNAN